ncbi:hypothetical protein KFU94_68300 [Chloroflexi bacterium TSY]|nr:hypothetical protein [Chloroflexi bacterium TSY]
MHSFRFTCFGPFAITVDGEPIEDMSADKARALLAYLILESDRVHARRLLVELLWPDYPQKDALRSLRNSLYRLRQLLDQTASDASDQFLTVTRQTLQFHTNHVNVDVARLEMLLDAVDSHEHDQIAHCPACLDRLTEAVSLYKGELLAGLSVADAPAFEEWLLTRREHLHLRVLLALQTLTDAHEILGDDEKAYRFATQRLTLDPYQESSLQTLMRLAARRGLPDQALIHYDRFRQLLQEEMGVEPNAETIALAEQIEGGDFDKDQGDKMTGWQGEGVTETDPLTPSPSHPLTLSPSHPTLRDIPQQGSFFGRHTELAQLEQWLVRDHCRVVAVLGIGGVGKTSLATHSVRAIVGHVDTVVWRSLLNAQPLDDLLPELIQTLSHDDSNASSAGFMSELSGHLDRQLDILIDLLRQQRVLLVLDNLESILVEVPVGAFRKGYETYGQLLTRVATLDHDSHLLFTSRERPQGIARLEGDTPLVRTLHLDGLDGSSGHALLAERGLSGSDAQEAELVERYSGNPLALKLVADTVDELFAGDIDEFLAGDALVFDNIRTVLDQQFVRLSALEKEILFWLVVNREPTTIKTLRADFLHSPPQRNIIEALRNLDRRSLVERMHIESAKGPTIVFRLQNVVTEYLTDRLVEIAVEELTSGVLTQLHQHPLMKAQTSEHVRRSQARLILQPVVEQVEAWLSHAGTVSQMRQILATLRRDMANARSYAGGTILNLLNHGKFDLTAFDFSQLSVWQAHLQSANLPSVNLAGADLTHTVFADVFSAIYSLAYSPDGHFLAAGDSAGRLWVWQVADGQLIRIMWDHTDSVMAVVFSPDGEMLASCSRDHTIHLRHARTGQMLQMLHEHTHTVWSIAFNPDGQTLASGGDEQLVFLWDVNSGALRHRLVSHTDIVRTIAFSPDGQTLASGGNDCVIRLWDMQTRQARTLPLVHTQWIRVLAFSPDGRTLASGGGEQIIHLWDTEAGQVSASLRGHSDAIRSLAFSPDGRTLVSASDDHTIRVWDVQAIGSGDGGRTLQTLRGHSDWAVCVDYSPDGQTLASGSNDQSILLWNLRSGEILRSFTGHDNWITSIALSPKQSAEQSLLAIGTHANAAHLWDMDTQKIRHTLHGHTGRVIVAVSADGSLLATCSTDQTVRVWDTRSGELLHLLHRHTKWVPTVAFSPDGRILASGGADQMIYLWDTFRGKLKHELAGHTGPVQSLTFSPDGQTLASASQDQTARLWDLSTIDAIETGQVHHILRGHTNWLHIVRFSPNGQILATGSADQTIRLWDVESGEFQRILHGHTGWVRDLAFSPDGEMLASSSSDQSVRLWDLSTSEMLFCLVGHEAPVDGVVFAPDGEMVIS